MSPSEIVAKAIDDHRAGRLAEADAGYRLALAVDPAHFDALHLLGCIRHRRAACADREPTGASPRTELCDAFGAGNSATGRLWQ